MKPYGKMTNAELIAEIKYLKAAGRPEPTSTEMKRITEVSALLEGARSVLRYREFKDAAPAIFDSCKNLIKATAGYVALLSRDGKQNELLFLDAGGRPCTVDRSLPMPVRGLREKAYRTRKTVYENNFPGSEWAGLMPKGHVALDNVLFAPLIVEGKAVGVIGIANKQGGFTENDAHLANAFGDLAAIALQNSRALESLEKSEERLRAVVETANDAILSVSGSGDILFWNRAAESIFGYSADEAVGKPLALIMPERLRETHDKGVAHVVATRKSSITGKTIKCVGIRKNNEEFPLEFSVAKSEVKEGIIFTALVRDITERRQAEEDLRIKSELLDSATDSIFLHDLDGNIIYVNDAAYNSRGYDRDELLRMKIGQFDTPEYFKLLEARIKELMTKGEGRFESAHVRKDGSIMPVEVQARIIASKGKKLILAIVRDITERKHAEETLRKAYEGLERKVEERTAELRKSYEAQTIINSLLSLLLKDIALEEILKQTLDRILSIPWLAFESRGCIFIVEDGNEVLVMKAQKGLADPIQKACARLPFGRCHCGRAALTQKVQFADCLDERHEISYKGINPHGHYCVPITSAGKIFGVINIYLKEGHIRGQNEEDFLTAIANALTGIIMRKRAEESLRESEKRYKKMVDSVSDYIYTVKIEQGRLVSTTHGLACVTVTGYTSEEYEADPGLWYRMIYEEDRGMVMHHAGKAQSGEASSVTHRIKHKDGSLRWVANTVVPRFDEQHRLIGYDGLVNDITERKLAEDSLKQSNEEMLALADASNVLLTITAPGENLFDTICDIVVRKFGLKMAWLGMIEHGSFDVKPIAQSGFEEGYLRTIKVSFDDSPMGLGPTGMAVKTLKHQVMNDITTDPRYAPWKEEALKRGYQASMASPLLSAEGKLIGVLNIYSGNPGFFTRERIKLFQIFSNQAATAIENRGLIEDLENKIKERTSELEVAKERAEAANRAKSDFLANMSHELRTPLNAVLGFSEMMVTGMAGALSPKQTEYLKHINESGAHLLSLINDILDLSKVEAGKMKLEYKEVDVRDVVDRVLLLFKEKMMKHCMQLTVEIEAGIGSVCADERGIKQVLLNLLSNAVKFTPDGGSVRVRARMTRGEGRGTKDEVSSVVLMSEASDRASSIEISVFNTGPGIQAEDIPKLFKPFQQLDSSYEKKHQGTGLGLALCKRIVELHNGKIWVESEVDKETVFIFVIPITRPECSGPKDMGL